MRNYSLYKGHFLTCFLLNFHNVQLSEDGVWTGSDADIGMGDQQGWESSVMLILKC